MTQFPLSDNLTGAWRARREGYAGTICDARLARFAGDRRVTAAVVVLTAVAVLGALSALRMPVVGVESRASGYGQSALELPMLGCRYPGVWIVLAALVFNGLLAVAAASWSGGPAARRAGNPLLIAASAAAALTAAAATVFLFTHTADLAGAALHMNGPEPSRFPIPKGGNWQFGPLWPYVATPGVALWTCAGATVTALAAPVLLGARALVRSVRMRLRP